MRLTSAYLRHVWLLHIKDRYVRWKNASNSDETIMLDLPSHTVTQNRYLWDNYDWSKNGEEWSNETVFGEKWKPMLINEIMLKHIKKGSTILEIGPGAGRWTETLQTLSKKLILVDISPTCLNICKSRFKNKNNIEYHLIEKRLNFIDDNVIDYIWSYDVFVHINPTDVDRYIADFSRILKPGGLSIIHHAGTYQDGADTTKGFRAHMTAELFSKLVAKHGMKMIEQDSKLVHKNGDIISIFVKI